MHKTILNHAAADQRRKKRERRRKKEEKKRKKKEPRRGLAGACLAGSRRRSPRRISLGLAGDPRFVCVCVFFFFFFRAVGLRDPRFFFFFFSGSGSRSLTSPSPSLAVALPRHLAATHLTTSRRPATETHGWVSPAVGLIFSWFFLGFRMIKSQKG
jgi:hypothetical protein